MSVTKNSRSNRKSTQIHPPEEVLEASELKVHKFEEVTESTEDGRPPNLIHSGKQIARENTDAGADMTALPKQTQFEIVLQRCRSQIVKELESGHRDLILVPIYPLIADEDTTLLDRLEDNLNSKQFMVTFDDSTGEECLEICRRAS